MDSNTHLSNFYHDRSFSCVLFLFVLFAFECFHFNRINIKSNLVSILYFNIHIIHIWALSTEPVRISRWFYLPIFWFWCFVSILASKHWHAWHFCFENNLLQAQLDAVPSCKSVVSTYKHQLLSNFEWNKWKPSMAEDCCASMIKIPRNLFVDFSFQTE